MERELNIVKITGGELYPYLKDITLIGRIETEEDWGAKDNFYIFGCKDEDQQKFYNGILEFDKLTKTQGFKTTRDVEEFWLDGCDGMVLFVKNGDYVVIE